MNKAGFKVLLVLLLVALLTIGLPILLFSSGLGGFDSEKMIQRDGVSNSFLLIGRTGVSDSWLYVGFASVYSITGTVREANGTVLQSASVTIDGGSATLTNSGGNYTQSTTTLGNHTFAVTKANYRTKTQTDVNITGNTTLNFQTTYALIPNAPILVYYLTCKNLYLYHDDEPEVHLGMTSYLTVKNAYLYPL